MTLLERRPLWTHVSFVLAKKIVQLDMQHSFLTSTEIEHMNQALVSLDTWKDFIQSTQDKTNLTAFRVRAMISEQFIPHFYHSNKPCCQSIKLDLKDIYNQVEDLLSNSNSNNESPIPTPMNSVTTMEQQVDGANIAQNTDHVPLLDIYHTLEFDMAAMIEQRKLEEYHAEEEQEANNNGEIDNTLAILDETNQFNLKYLLKGIAENRSKTLLSDRELRNLLSEVKPHRSKWANDDKVGQEELYEACEKVLLDLRNYTEHSTPFLSKVSKREAPDYFEVIKEPMDLGTVSKKLKSFQYKNKREFGNDLYLIYENCLIYNSDPSNEYRKHAIAMKRRTDRLMQRVPDIVIKDNNESGDEEELNHSRRGSTRERSESIDETTPYQGNGGKHPAPLQPLNETEESQVINEEIEIDKGELQNKIWREITKKTRANLTTNVEKQYQFEFGNRIALSRNSLDMEKFYLLEHLHHQPETTKKLMRCSKTAFVRWLNRRKEEEDELVQSSVYDEFDLNSEDEEGFDGGFFFSNTKGDSKQQPTNEDDAVRIDLFLPEYDLNCGLPEIEGIPEEYMPITDNDEEEEEETVPSLDIYPTTQLNRGQIDENIKKLRMIRSTHTKCNSILNNLPLLDDTIDPIMNNTPSPHMMDIGSPIPNHISTATPPLIVNQESSHLMIQRSLIQILSHAGFESAQSNALNAITDLVSEHFLNIGKTLRKYLDGHGKSMSIKDILTHTLTENGINGVQDLDDYVTQNIQHYGDRLDDIHCKLENTYKDLINESVDDTKESNLFEDNNEAFITGLFDEELGEDFFGFKELGVDSDMKSLRVPNKLWYGKDLPTYTPMLSIKNQATPVQKYTSPPPFIPIQTPGSLVGLLQPWYSKRLEENQTIEDEYIPKTKRNNNMPRYPPVNIRSAYIEHQQNTIKKRVLKDGSNTNASEETKRKRKRAMEESKAQKKQQKLELKAQKLAEKEQKKKQREEEKLAKKKNS